MVGNVDILIGDACMGGKGGIIVGEPTRTPHAASSTSSSTSISISCNMLWLLLLLRVFDESLDSHCMGDGTGGNGDG